MTLLAKGTSLRGKSGRARARTAFGLMPGRDRSGAGGPHQLRIEAMQFGIKAREIVPEFFPRGLGQAVVIFRLELPPF